MRKGFLIGFCFLLLCCSVALAADPYCYADSAVASYSPTKDAVDNRMWLDTTINATLGLGIDGAGLSSCNCTFVLYVNDVSVQTKHVYGVANQSKCSVKVGNSTFWTNGDVVRVEAWTWSNYGLWANSTFGPDTIKSLQGSFAPRLDLPEPESPGAGSFQKILKDYNPRGYDRLDSAFQEWVEGEDIDHFFVSGGELLKALILYMFKQPGSLVPGGGLA